MEEKEGTESSSSEGNCCDSGCCSRENKEKSTSDILDDAFELESILPSFDGGVSDCCNKREDNAHDCCGKDVCCPPKPANLSDMSLTVMDPEVLKIIQQCCCLRGTVCCSDLVDKSWCCDYILTWQSQGRRLSELRFTAPSPASPSVGSLTFDVEGMTCSSCESTLKSTLLGIQGVDLVSVSVVLGRAVVEGNVLTEEVMQVVYAKTGFKLTLVSNQPTLFLRFDECPRQFPPDVAVSCHGNTVKFTYDPKRITPRQIFDFYDSEKQDNIPIVVDELEVHSHVWNTLGCRVIVSIILAIPVLVLAYIPPRPIIYGAIQLSLVTGIMGYVISPLYKQSLHTLLRRREIEMDLLVVCSTLISYIFSIISYIFTCLGGPISPPFWETPALLVTLIMLGRWTTTWTRDRAVQAVKKLSDTNVKTAMLETGRVVDVALLGIGDVVTVQPGDTIPTDGVLVRGKTEVSEAMFTGESHAKLKCCGDTVFAGSVNLISRVDIQVTKLTSENALSGIRQLIDISQVSKPRIQAYTDRVAGYLGPVALCVAIIAFIVWFFVDWRVRGNSVSEAAIQGVTYAIAVLAISCPCTIGLAVPMNVVIASGIAAARGILIKDTQALEVCHRVGAVVFDKTGTVTRGEPSVVEEVLFVQGAQEYVARLVAGGRHPIAKAVSTYLCGGKGFDCVKTVVGKGLEVRVEKGLLRGGNMRWLGVVKSGLTAVNGSVFCVTLNGELIASYGLSDELRPESVDVVKSLQERKVDVYLVSGDNAGAASEIAKKLGIPKSRVQSNVLPAEKAQFIRNLQQQSKSPVIFCGDGINDAAALSQANIGISFVSASELTSSSATVLFLSSDLSSILTLITLSRRVYHRILLNFCWAGVYNLFAICLAAGVFVVWRIEPQWAGIGEFISVMPVVIVGWSLKWQNM